jgi:hypothetical protein
MKISKRIVPVLAMMLLIPAVTGAGDDDASTIQGEVAQVHENVRTRNGGEFDELTVRTRQGEQMRLRLGRAGGCPDCVRAGDRVRARVMANGPDDGALDVREMKVRRTGETHRFRDESGGLVQTHQRSRTRTGSAAGSCPRNGSGTGAGGHGGGGHRGGGRR